MKQFPEPPAEHGSVTPAELKARIDAGEQVTIVDTRPPEAFERWQITGEHVTTLNLPHTAVHPDVDEERLSELPTDRRLTAVCAIGKSSAYVAGVLADRGHDVEQLEEGMEGWARLYERHELTDYSGPGRIWQYQRPSSGCLAHLVVSGGEAAVVDPLRAFADRYLEDTATAGVELNYAIDTHVHADHVSGLWTLTEAGVSGVVPEPAAERGVVDAAELSLLGDGDRLQVGDVSLEAVHTPGHTSGMTSFLVGGSVLLSGDGLFLESVARPDLETGDEGAPDAARQLYRSIHGQILTLPGETLVCPTHYARHTTRNTDDTYAATLSELRERLPALSRPEESFVEYVLSDMPPRPANFEAIIETNVGRREPDDEAAFELELGPNNCAATDTASSD